MSDVLSSQPFTFSRKRSNSLPSLAPSETEEDTPSTVVGKVSKSNEVPMSYHWSSTEYTRKRDTDDHLSIDDALRYSCLRRTLQLVKSKESGSLHAEEEQSLFSQFIPVAKIWLNGRWKDDPKETDLGGWEKLLRSVGQPLSKEELEELLSLDIQPEKVLPDLAAPE